MSDRKLHMYGLLSIHKDGILLRPIVISRDTVNPQTNWKVLIMLRTWPTLWKQKYSHSILPDGHRVFT